jgi:CheY-like chemotaxis protein
LRELIVRMLVVDDEYLVLLATASMLEDLGCEVETASDAIEALSKLGNDPQIDALITDVNMPGLSGIELAEQATKSQPDLKIILLSGAAIDPRGWTLIRKPFMQSDLMRAMEATTGLC